METFLRVSYLWADPASIIHCRNYHKSSGPIIPCRLWAFARDTVTIKHFRIPPPKLAVLFVLRLIGDRMICGNMDLCVQRIMEIIPCGEDKKKCATETYIESARDKPILSFSPPTLPSLPTPFTALYLFVSLFRPPIVSVRLFTDFLFCSLFTCTWSHSDSPLHPRAQFVLLLASFSYLLRLACTALIHLPCPRPPYSSVSSLSTSFPPQLHLISHLVLISRWGRQSFPNW